MVWGSVNFFENSKRRVVSISLRVNTLGVTTLVPKLVKVLWGLGGGLGFGLGV